MPDHKYDITKPVVREPKAWGWRRFWAISARNYGVWPVLIILGAIYPGALTWFLYHRLNNTPDATFTRRGSWDPEPFNRFEHRYATLGPIDMELVLRKHPDPGLTTSTSRLTNHRRSDCRLKVNVFYSFQWFYKYILFFTKLYLIY